MLLALLIACAAAEGHHPDSGGAVDSGTGLGGDCSADTADSVCVLPGHGTTDPAAARQYSLVLTAADTEADVESVQGGSGTASIGDEGMLRWDVAPGGAVGITEDGAGFSGEDVANADGSTSDGCSMAEMIDWSVSGAWSDADGFNGEFTLIYGFAIGEDGCSASLVYAAVATPA
jgi:hypothetical protein